MNQTAHQADDSQQPLPENVDCPLCCSAVATATRAPQGKVVCDACGLSFSAFDAAERRRRLDEERERQKAEKRRANEVSKPELPVHPLQQWLSGAPWELPRRTSWQQNMLWMRQHRWLTAATVLSVLGPLIFCVILSRSVQVLSDQFEETRLRYAELQRESKKVVRSHTDERSRWQDEREQLYRRLNALEQGVNIAGLQQTAGEPSELDLDAYPTTAARTIQPQLPLDLSPLPSAENEEPISGEDAAPAPPVRAEPPLSSRSKTNDLR